MAVLDTVRDLSRLKEIVQVLAHHGFAQGLARIGLASLLGRAPDSASQNAVSPEQCRLALVALGPTFIKLGQLLSTRADLVPVEFLEELRKLQDRVAPVAAEEVRTQIETEFACPLDELFEEFDLKPIATASIAQVHQAKLRVDGEVREVAVKVQRPAIGPLIERDLELLHTLARALERTWPESRAYRPTHVVAEFERSIREELDFVLEAENARRFCQNFEGNVAIRVPRVHSERSGRTVLTLEYLEGRRLHDALNEGYSAERICRTTLSLLLKSVFEDGFFHADPHPGNFILMGTAETPVIGVVDFGMMGRLTPRVRDLAIDLLVGAVREDYRAMSDALIAMGGTRNLRDRNAFESEVARLANDVARKKLGQIETSRLLHQLVRTASDFDLAIPSDFILVARTIMTAEGVAREIYPEFDVFEEIKPYFLRLMWSRYAPERLSEQALRAVQRLSGAAQEFPTQGQEVLDDLRRGRLELRTRQPSLRPAADILGKRLASGVLGASGIVGAAFLIAEGSMALGAAFAALGLTVGTLGILAGRTDKREK